MANCKALMGSVVKGLMAPYITITISANDIA